MLMIGDLVEVKGRLYEGEAVVIAAWERESGPGELPLGIHEFREQAYPQICVRTVTGRDLHYNGDDLADGKISFIRHLLDLSKFKHGSSQLEFGSDGVYYPAWFFEGLPTMMFGDEKLGRKRRYDGMF